MKLVPATMKCEHCGKVFARRNSRQRLCSKQCQIAVSASNGWAGPYSNVGAR